jgi:hypothetical protein
VKQEARGLAWQSCKPWLLLTKEEPHLQTHVTGNFALAPMQTVRNTVEAFWGRPGTKLLVVASYIGKSRSAKALILIDGTETTRFEDQEYTFFEFFEDYLGLVPVVTDLPQDSSVNRAVIQANVRGLVELVRGSNDLTEVERGNVLGYLEAVTALLNQPNPDQEGLRLLATKLMEKVVEISKRAGERFVTSEILEVIKDLLSQLPGL